MQSALSDILHQNADIPRSDVPSLIDPSVALLYNTRMQIYQNADIPRSDVPLVIDPSVP